MNAAAGDPMAMRRLARLGHSAEVLAFPKSGSSQAVLRAMLAVASWGDGAEGSIACVGSPGLVSSCASSGQTNAALSEEPEGSSGGGVKVPVT